MPTEFDDIEIRPARRRFLRGGAALAATLVAPGLMLYQTGRARSPDEPVDASVRWGLLIDIDALSESDIDACVQACQREHGLSDTGNPQTDAQWVRKVKLTDAESGHQKFLPMMCQHCEHPPCVDVCPTGASFKRADGIVLVDKHTCIGCRYCMMACPYKARSFIHEQLKDQLPGRPARQGHRRVLHAVRASRRPDGENAVPACAEACQSQRQQNRSCSVT